MIRCLSFHAPYRCRHSGACCRAGWTIPFEDGTVAARSAHGACTFLDDGSQLCSIHRAGGVHALPITCRMFPRIVLHDARGTFVSLSHFCPTAAALLFDDSRAVAIVEAPPALAAIGELDGLDARGEWPPLLRPGVLMDFESYGAWEAAAVSQLTTGSASARDALEALDEITRELTTWAPGSGALIDRVHAVFGTSKAPTTSGERADAAVKRWLAARLFGAWSAYQGDGLASTLRFLRMCLQTVDEERAVDGNPLEAIRRSDLRILHAAGPERPGLQSL
jgi:hypothetical protein